MPIGSVWGADTWLDGAWANNTWANVASIPAAPAASSRGGQWFKVIEQVNDNEDLLLLL